MDVGERLRERIVDPDDREEAFRRYAEDLRRARPAPEHHETLGERLAAIRAAADRPAGPSSVHRLEPAPAEKVRPAVVETTGQPRLVEPTPAPPSAQPAAAKGPGGAPVAARRPGMRGHLVAVVAGTALLLVAALGGIAAQDDPAPPQDTGVAGRKVGVVWAAPLLSWLRDSVEPGTRVAAPQGVVARLRLELPELRITRLGADEGARLLVLPSAGGRDPAFLGRHGLRRQAEPVAAFEGGLTVVVVNSRATAADKRARARLGRALVRETNLRLTPEAWSVLTRGGVDLQLLEGLRTLVVDHTVDVSDFPRDAATRAARAPARSADIVAVDGRLVGAPDLDLDAAARLVTAAMPHSPAVTIDPTADQPALRLTVRLAGAAE